MKIPISSVRGAVLLLALFTLQLSTYGQGTAFTYQGRLTVSGSPANGSYDLRFTIYDSEIGGSAVAGPLTNSQISVTGGLFLVRLDFGSTPFSVGAVRWLENAVRSNGTGAAFTTLAPRQLVTATPYAITAANVTGPINGNSIANGTITSAQLAPGATATNLQASSQSIVPSGGMILSSNRLDSKLAGAGYVMLGRVELGGGGWSQKASGGLTGRGFMARIWTGSDMILWGGYDGASHFFSDGARYNQAANTWTALTTNGAPSARDARAAVWTGTEMLIWGGEGTNSNLSDGGRYSPTVDSWTPISTNGAPTGRSLHSAVWSSSELIVWGGTGMWGPTGALYLSDGARYSPTINMWTALTTNGAPAARYGHTAVWTGTEMIIWGGTGNAGNLNDGARYNPVSDSWTPVASSGAPSVRYGHTVIWTGSEMFIWGGYNGTTNLNDGARYDPNANEWTPIMAVGAPGARRAHTAVWTGREMVVWGGSNGNVLNDGARYDRAENSWTSLATSGTPSARSGHMAFWAGKEMIVWGGISNTSYLNDTFSYVPSPVLYLYERP